MPKKPTCRPKAVLVPITPRQWRGLKVEAKLLTDVFGTKFTPAGLARQAIDRRLGAK